MTRFAIALTCLILAACTPMGNLQPSGDVRYLTAADIASMAKEPTRIQAGDTLRIVRDAHDASMDLRNLVEDSQAQLYVVRPDGSFSFRYAGRVEAVGKTPDELAAELDRGGRDAVLYLIVTRRIVGRLPGAGLGRSGAIAVVDEAALSRPFRDSG